MLFPTLEFLLFFILVFLLFWYIFPLFFKEKQLPFHILLLSFSYIFYMSWNVYFVSLIFFSTLIDFFIGKKLNQTTDVLFRKQLLYLSVILNIVFILGFFKYYNFFANSLNQFLSIFSFEEFFPILKITLPVGISFFTFQSLSYTIDIYRNKILPEKNFVHFALFVSFFPQLVAGPIVTAKEFLPQLKQKKSFSEIPFRIAFRTILLGYFKKAVLSDNVSPISDSIYSNPEAFGTNGAWLAAFLFWVQVYCDFSGYTDMAYGVALLLGYKLPDNFNLPYISKSITEHWRRWHITLSNWLKDYVYISLGGSRVSYWRHKFNIGLTMLLGGFWHGANWTFVVWGFLQGLLLVIESLFQDFLKKNFLKLPVSRLANLTKILITSFFTIVLGTCFRSESLEKEWILLKKMFFYEGAHLQGDFWKIGLLCIFSVILGHYLGKMLFERKVKFKILTGKLEFILYIPIILILLLLTPENEVPFIYFQF